VGIGASKVLGSIHRARGKSCCLRLLRIVRLIIEERVSKVVPER
jgi:hypothetical protein